MKRLDPANRLTCTAAGTPDILRLVQNRDYWDDQPFS